MKMKTELSPRQTQIAELVRRGYADKQIADELKITRSAVRRHIEKAFVKLDLHCRAELAVAVAVAGGGNLTTVHNTTATKSKMRVKVSA